jgi:hypothetical protein
MFFIAFLSIQSAFAQDSGDSALCDLWGQIEPDSISNVNLGETYKFFIGGQNCGDSAQCNWSMDPSDVATLSDTTGSPVDWTAPEELQDCISEEVRLILDCPSLDGTGTLNDETTLVVSCTLAEKESLIGSQDWTIDGGGCGTRTAAFLAFPLLLGWYRRT